MKTSHKGLDPFFWPCLLLLRLCDLSLVLSITIVLFCLSLHDEASPVANMAPLGFPIYTRDKTSPRGFRWIWFIRVLQIWITLAVLGITASNAASFKDYSCSVPGKLAWNLACAVLGLLALAYFFLSTGPTPMFKILPWWIFIQLGLDTLMFIFWLSAAAASHYTCNDLCNACSNLASLSFGGLSCICDSASYYDYYDDYYDKRAMSPVKKGPLESRRTHHPTRSTGSTAAKQGLDAIMVVLFAVTLASTCFWIFQNRRQSTTTTTAPATNPAANAEAGVQQVSAEMKQDAPYNPNAINPNQGGYAPVSPIQQQTYPPQGQYPPQQPQQGGYPPQQQYRPQEPYSQPQQPAQVYHGGSDGQPIPNYPNPTPEMQAERRDV